MEIGGAGEAIVAAITAGESAVGRASFGSGEDAAVAQAGEGVAVAARPDSLVAASRSVTLRSSLFTPQVSDETTAPTLALSTITPSVRSHNLPSPGARPRGGSLGTCTGGGAELNRAPSGRPPDLVGRGAAACCRGGLALGGVRRTARARFSSDAFCKVSAGAGGKVVDREDRTITRGLVGRSPPGSTAGGKSLSVSRFDSREASALRFRCLRRSAIFAPGLCAFFKLARSAQQG
jgi:hypothetical protein